MTDAPIRKYVKPAHPDAKIPDPSHPGMDLPASGTEVTWDHYWIGRERRGEIEVADIAAPAVKTPPHDAPDEAAH